MLLHILLGKINSHSKTVKFNYSLIVCIYWKFHQNKDHEIASGWVFIERANKALNSLFSFFGRWWKFLPWCLLNKNNINVPSSFISMQVTTVRGKHVSAGRKFYTLTSPRYVNIISSSRSESFVNLVPYKLPGKS